MLPQFPAASFHAGLIHGGPSPSRSLPRHRPPPTVARPDGSAVHVGGADLLYPPAPATSPIPVCGAAADFPNPLLNSLLAPTLTEWEQQRDCQSARNKGASQTPYRRRE
jgi:hypothetical protein